MNPDIIIGLGLVAGGLFMGARGYTEYSWREYTENWKSIMWTCYGFAAVSLGASIWFFTRP